MDEDHQLPALNLRRAGTADASAIAELYLSARRAAVPAVPYLVHTAAEVRRWVADVVVAEYETWVAASGDGALRAFASLDDGELEQLYVHPQFTGRGIGSSLLALAKQLRPAGLGLWTFQRNTGARRFYERHGFVTVGFTDGAAN